MAYLPSGGLSELVQLRPGFLHILRTRALTECDLIVVIDRDPPVAVFADPFENRVTEPAQPYGRMEFGQGAGSGAHGRKFEKLAFEGEAVFRPQPLHHSDAFHCIIPTAFETTACKLNLQRSEETTSELQSQMPTSNA